MSQSKDLTGCRFGRLTVVRFDRKEGRHSYWECLCDCGKTSVTEGSRLTCGITKSCGCLRREKAKEKGKIKSAGQYKIKDLTGRRFGRWTALRFVRRENHRTLWECRCDCGETRLVAANNLTSGQSKSCGCMNRELASERMKTVRQSRGNKHAAAPKPEPKPAPVPRPLVEDSEVDILYNLIFKSAC